MHSRIRMKGILLAALVAVLASVALPGAASAEPQPGAKKKGFRLFARALGAMTVNRIYCGLASDGRVCVDSTNSSTIGGGFWPKGTADQYVFNSGLQVAGIIGTDGGVWAGDTVGGFFFDPKGTTEHGEEVQPLFNATGLDASGRDAAGSQWPEAGCVPNQANDADGNLFDPLLQTGTNDYIATGCRISASQGDVWFMSWEGNPSLKAGRKHPLGVAVETRGLGWNFPSGNEDILYFIYSFYNITSKNRADYNAIRPALADILYQKALDFHAQNLAQGVDLPDAGYTIENMFAAFSADMDVAEAGSNYSGVNLPFALGHTYDHTFSKPTGWTFDPSIFSPPFFSGAGFVGVKYLKSPTGAGAIQLFGNTINGGAFGDARDVVQLYRYLSGSLSPAAGDQACNNGNPTITHICYVNNGSPADMRFFQSSTPLTLPPAGRGSIVVAYIFAAPVATGSCPGPSCDLRPGDGTLLTNALNLPTTGANAVDSVTGYRGFSDANINGVVEQDEIAVVPGSLLGKALVAQAVFDAKFLLPFAPDAPDFFLIPGDNQVTVIWKPSVSEQTGDPYFNIASLATVGVNNNALYDPNYRQFDVEGYRIYRGRVDAPNELTLVAQYDYAGTVISDFTGIINSGVDCAPEYNIGVGSTCPVAYPNGGNQKDGTTLTAHVDYELAGDIVQVKAGSGRIPLADGTAYTTKSDTAVVGGGKAGSCGPKSACPALDNTGVPFSYVDRTPRNNFRYFYSVTAFDINSIESGPTSLESPRNTKSTTPVHASPNYVNTAALTAHVVGRGVAMDTIITSNPTINPTTGVFSGPQRPADGLTAAFVGELAKQVIAAPGAFQVTLDSIDPTGEGSEEGCCGGVAAGTPTIYYFTAQSGSLVTQLQVPIQTDGNSGATRNGGEAFFSAVSVDNSLAQRYGGNSTFQLKGTAADTIPSFYLGAAQLLGCRIKGGPITGGTNDCIYNGPRWFDSPSTPTSSPLPSARLGTETFADPISGNCKHNGGNNPVCAAVSFNNAGALTGVTTIQSPASYGVLIRRWRNMESSMAPFWRAADMNVYWGTNGRIDSVIDVTHNVPVPDAFIRNGAGAVVGVRPLAANWGIINPGATNFASTSADGRPAVLTMADLPCFEPYRSIHASPQFPNADGFPCAVTGATPYAPGQPFTPDTIAQPGQVAYFVNTRANAAAAPVAAGAGFGLYITGTYSQFELTGGALPAAGTVWTLRTYAGMVYGGQGVGGGSLGLPYSYTPATRPFTAVGASVQVAFDVVNTTRAVTTADLKQVHTVPDPYYVTNGYEQTTDNKVIKFVNLPRKAIIRIYSSSGVLVNILEHNSNTFGGELTWNVRNRNNQVVSSGVYFYHIESNDAGTARRVGRMTIVNFAQ